MSLRPQTVPPVPEETARIARLAFPKGNLYLQIRDEIGVLLTDADFVDLFPARGQPAYSPWRLALITIFQFIENLSDRAAAEAVRARIDWKYALSLDLENSGFDSTVLCEFRARLVAENAENLLFEKLLDWCREQKMLKTRGRQRTDSTHVLAAVRGINRLECVLEAAPRILFALSRDGLFSPKLATVNKGGTPAFALALTILISVILAATGTFESLLAVSAFMGLTVDSSVFLSLFILRKREPDLPRPFRARGYPLVPLIILVGSILLLVAYVISNTMNSVFALTAMAVSYPIFLIVRVLNKKRATGNF